MEEKIAYKPYKHNPRKISADQLDRLEDTLRRLGDLSGIIYNEKSKQFIGGNQRSKAINFDECQVEIIEEYDKPDKQGTVAWGFVIWEGNRYNFRRVRWTPKVEREANIVANKGGGDWDFDVLKEHFKAENLIEWGFSKSEISWFDKEAAEEGSSYTKKVGSPLYEPSGECPDVMELFDDEYYLKLVTEIEARDLPEPTKEFLKLAACRHVVFNYEKIADFYAHADAGVQKLMEDSALVIIDFRRAIELGFVRLTEELRNQYLEDYAVEE